MTHLYVFLFGLFTSIASAQQDPPTPATSDAQGAAAEAWINRYCTILNPNCGSGSAFVAELFATIVNKFVLPLVAAAAIGAVMYGGIKLITSAGNDQGKEDAKNILKYAGMGLFFTVMTWTILNFVVWFLNQTADTPVT